MDIKALRTLVALAALPLALLYWPAACAGQPPGPASHGAQASPSETAEPGLIHKSLFEGLLPHPAFALAQTGGDAASIADVAEKTTPSVVAVTSERVSKRPPMPHMFGPFFGPPGGTPEKQHGLGSGVIVSGDGIVLTNNHVVEDASEIKVTTIDNQEYEAEVVGTDAKSDLAVLRIKGNPTGLKPITFGDSSQLRLGDVVLAIGNPFGVGQTVTMGIVSAKGRADVGIVDYEDFIQTDAAINPGNSGGALVNMRGELVGVNTAILSRSGGYQGIGFAIPTNMAQPIMQSLLKDGKVARGFLGIGIQELTPELAQALSVPKGDGVLVTEVHPGSAAEKAGLKQGDVVLEVDGKAVKTTGQLRNRIAASGADKPVILLLQRGEKRVTAKVTLGHLPDADAKVSAGKAPKSEDALGMELSELTPQIANRLGIDPKQASGKVVISGVSPGSAAADAGLRAGDVLSEINQRKVSSVAAAKKAIRASKGNLLLLVERGGNSRFVVVKR